MIKKYDFVIWDVDGTLLNTSEGIISSAKYTISRMGYDIPSEDVMKTYIGPPIQNSFANTLPITEEIAMKMANMFRTHYKKYDLLKANPYPGIINVCESLAKAGIRQAVATYKRQDYASVIVDHFGFSKYMTNVCGSDAEGKMTKSDIIRNAIRESGINKERILMIGDTNNDAIGAQKHGIDFLAVTYGFGYKKDECSIGKGIRYIANTSEDILSVLEVQDEN